MSITKRVDHVSGIPDEYRKAVIPAPISVKLELTSRCNFRCTYCTKPMETRKHGDMDRELYSKIIKELKEAGVKELGLFFLGESFLCRWLPEAIKEAKDIGFEYVFLTTNGSVANPDIVEKCMDAGLDSLKFSFNYYSAEQMNAMTGVGPLFYFKIIENIKSAFHVRKANGYRCGLYASYVELSDSQSMKMAEAVADIQHYLDEVYALPLYKHSMEANKDKDKVMAGNIGRADNARSGLPCWTLHTEGHIWADGSVIACCFDYDGRFNMGNLKDKPFMEIWNSKEFVKLREASLKQDVTGTLCEDCMAYTT